MADEKKANYNVKSVCSNLHDLKYLELCDFARHILFQLALASKAAGDVPDIEDYPAIDVDNMARALLSGSNDLNEVYNS